MNKLYIGDGVYVSVDEYGNVKLETQRDLSTHWMVLEPWMCRALVEFFKDNDIIKS